MMHKPWHSLVFALAVFAALAFAGQFFPPGGVALGNGLVVDFPSPGQLLRPAPERATVSAVLAAINRVDTAFRIDEPGESVDSARQVAVQPALNVDIQYENPDAMRRFYDALNALRADPSSVRVLHYGDSQIEGDRITGYLRQKLQQQFGGTGPGLISFVPLTSSPSQRVIAVPDWERYTIFTSRDSRVPHDYYGVRGAFYRFTPVSDTSGAVSSATVQVLTAPKASGSVAEFTRIRMYYGGARSRTWCGFYDGPSLVMADSLEAGGSFHFLDYPVAKGSRRQEFRFSGNDSPDFYALSLEGGTGVMVDNIAMRGSSGTFFHLVDAAQMRSFYEHLNVRLVILQFGGNALPAITDTTKARNYAGYMRYQVALVKKLAPRASILFVGPADMSVKKGTVYVTHPLLESVRDHLRREMLAAGCAYFDMYGAMGGRNSMPVWVEEDLAGSDYTHFSPKGARKIASVLYAALIKDYNHYLRSVQ